MRRVLVLLLALCLGASCNGAEERKREAKRTAEKAARAAAKAERERQKVAAIEDVRVSIARLGTSPKPEDLLKACEFGLNIDALKLDPSIANTCAGGYLAMAKTAVRRKELQDADMHLKNLTVTGVTSDEISEVRRQYDSLAEAEREREERKRAREEFVAGSASRKDYGSELRTHFLDQGMDIKVSVSGQHNERLKLKFVLFNDVWMHNFKKGTLIDEIRGKGFKRVDLSDGYDWGYYFTFGE